MAPQKQQRVNKTGLCPVVICPYLCSSDGPCPHHGRTPRDSETPSPSGGGAGQPATPPRACRLREMEGAAGNPAPRNHLLVVGTAKASGCRCTDASGGSKYRRGPSPFSDRHSAGSSRRRAYIYIYIYIYIYTCLFIYIFICICICIVICICVYIFIYIHIHVY